LKSKKIKQPGEKNPFYLLAFLVSSSYWQTNRQQRREESHTGPVRHTLAGTQADVKVGGDATTQRSSCGQHQNGK
jgi:hypothetical protein